MKWKWNELKIKWKWNETEIKIKWKLNQNGNENEMKMKWKWNEHLKKNEHMASFENSMERDWLETACRICGIPALS
jgi:hypothetical protein